ncbi:hypothetical protein AGMMS49965_24490 [Bacteroidia bacterium]|nr:hypothetical protein AGMMS49965_24490 [Bacteroidia bacterium]
MLTFVVAISMKTRHIHIILLCIILLAGCKEKDEFVVEGRIAGATNPTVCFVTRHDSTPRIETVYMKEGRFRFTASSKSLQPVVIYFERGTNWVTVWAQNGQTITLHGDVNDPEQIRIRGNQVNNLLTDFKQEHKNTTETALVADAEDFVKNHPTSIASLVVIQDYLLGSAPEKTVEACLNWIQSPAKDDPLYQRLCDEILQLE